MTSRKTNTPGIKLALCAVLLLPLIFGSTVFAQDRLLIEGDSSPAREPAPAPTRQPGERPPDATAPDAEVQILESNAADTTTAAEGNSPRGKRIKARIARLNIKVNEAEAAKLKRLCRPTQAKLERYRQRVVGVSVSQEQTKSNLLERLNRLSDKLRLAGVETAELNQKISGLQNEYGKLVESLENFGTAVDDAAEMECAADPEGYKASLVEARKLRAQVVANAKAVKSFIQNELKPTLLTARQSLAGSTEESQ